METGARVKQIMQRWMLVFTALSAGCQSQESGGGDEAQCEFAQECRDMAESRARRLAEPDTRSRLLASAVCKRIALNGSTEGNVCDCTTTQGTVMLGPKGIGCTVLSRSGGCLWDNSEIEPCDLDGDECAALCEEAVARLQADADRAFDVEVRYAVCQNGQCHDVLRVEDRCFADNWMHPKYSADCSLGGEQIVKRTEDAVNSRVPSCSQGVDSQGMCVDE
jgi:hypothetical protein